MSPSAYAFPAKILIKISGRSGMHFIRARAFYLSTGISIDAAETYEPRLLKQL